MRRQISGAGHQVLNTLIRSAHNAAMPNLASFRSELPTGVAPIGGSFSTQIDGLPAAY
jgi:hypothetical protein